MKMFLLCLLVAISPYSIEASAMVDTMTTPSVIQLAKISKPSSKAKYWVVYHSPDDLMELERNGYAILKTKVKMIRNNDFWLSMWQSSLQMAMGYVVASKKDDVGYITLPNQSNIPQVNLQKIKHY